MIGRLFNATGLTLLGLLFVLIAWIFLTRCDGDPRAIVLGLVALAAGLFEIRLAFAELAGYARREPRG